MSASDTSRQQQGYAAIKNKVPQWLLEATGETRKAMRVPGLEAISWVSRSAQMLPGLVARLQGDYLEHRALDAQVGTLLRTLDDPERFAEPLLKAALHARFGIDVDVRQTWLFQPWRMRKDDSFLSASKDWAVEGFKAFRLACRPLLSVALQNFEAWESEPGGMDLSLTKAKIFKVLPGQPLWGGETLDLSPELFASVCRELDLGALYQKLIAQVVGERTQDGTADAALMFRREALFKRHEQSGLLLHLHLARMQELICEPLYQALCLVVHNRDSHDQARAISCSGLVLWDIELSGIVVFGSDGTLGETAESVVVYVPGDPEQPLREHASFLGLGEYLRDRLLQPEYLKFFQRFIPLRHRARLLEKLHRTFYPKVWNAGGWYEEILDRKAHLPLRQSPLEGALMPALFRRKVAALKDDGLFLAVPTAAQDHKSLEEKLEYFAQAGLYALNALAFAVPVVGAVMMVFSAAQLAHEVYEGIGEWTRGEREQAWDYLLDVVENLALMTAIGAAGTGDLPAHELPRLPDALHPVRLSNGATRLWSRDLGTFAHDLVLPADATPDARGLYDYRGKRWLSLDGRSYAVAEREDASAYLQHPWRTDAYQPAVRYNGGGIWLHELDQPREWWGLALFRRLGVMAEGLDERAARHVLLISGCHEAQLRRALADGRQPPALLLDSLDRYQMNCAWEEGGQAQGFQRRVRQLQWLHQLEQEPEAVAERVIRRDFKGLSRRLAQELLEHATPAEQMMLKEQQRVPPRLAQEARLYLQSVRLARAYEGFYLKPLGSQDSDRLMLHSLAALPGWAEQYRVEIRALRADGPLLDSIGPFPAVHRQVLVKSAEGYRIAEEPAVAAEGLVGVVWRTLTSPQRRALGLAAEDAGRALRRKVLARPLERPALRKVLHMQAVRPAMRSPMRLANGRPGYPLSGRGRLPPVLSENTLLDKIRLLELPDAFASELLLRLRGAGLDDAAIDGRLNRLLDEREQLMQALPLGDEPDTTADSPSGPGDRQLIELALWQHWRDNLLPEIGRGAVPLRLYAVSLERFPTQLPDFFRMRVGALELSRVSMPATLTMAGAEEGAGPLDALLRLLHCFPRITMLEIDGLVGHSLHELPRRVVGAYPQLVELRLLNLNLTLDQALLDELCRLQALRYLDLSGNRPGDLPIMLSEAMTLKFLGLERLGLTRWPEWLDSEALYQIERLSLRDNRLTSLPGYLSINPVSAERSTWISLHGNLFSHQTLIGIRANTWQGQGQGRRFHFDLAFPQTVETAVAALMAERETLSGAIDRWLEASRLAQLGDERLAVRREFADALRRVWASSDFNSARALVLEDLCLEDFPDHLPAFYYQRTVRLELVRPIGSAAQIDALITRFSHLERLSIVGGPLTELPVSVGNLAALSALSLIDTGLLIEQSMIDTFARMRRLTVLELGGNRLGDIRDVSAFGRLSFQRLGLQRMDIQRWPQWLDAPLLERVQWLNLNHNRLDTLPPWLLENAESSHGSTEISLEDNSLSADVVAAARRSEGLARPYSFNLDGSGHDHRDGSSWRSSDSAGGSLEMDLLNVDTWLEQGSIASEVRRQLWEQLEGSGQADMLLRLIGRLRYTADYRSAATRPDLVERVWQVLTMTAQAPELRVTLNGMAEEPLRQVQDFDTCPDGIRLEFNQMEILVFTTQALRVTGTAQRGPAFYRLMRQLYRLSELDNVARIESGARDEAEVRLAYRMGLAKQLDLPLAPERMLYAGSASLQPGELERAAVLVREGESGQGLLDYAARQDFWLGYLRDRYAERFTAIREAFEAQVLGLPDLYPDDLPVQSSARIQTLIDQRTRDEAVLVGELTHHEGLQAEQT